MIGTPADLALHSAGVKDALSYSRDGATYAQVESLVEEGLARIWVNGESGIISKFLVIHNSGDLETLMWLAWGNLAELIPLVREVEEYSRRVRASRVTIVGRLGWDRTPLTKELGFSARHVLYEKELA